VAAQSPDNLGALPASQAPAEVRPLIDSLNALLARLAATLENERRFTADAAHELRTPLAALKVQAQVALASDVGEEQRHALRQVLAGTERAARLVNQLLRLARLDPLGRLDRSDHVVLAAVVEEAADALAPLALAKRQVLQVHLPEPDVSAPGDADLLGTALRNLLDNAIRYSPEGSEIEMGAEADGPCLWVSDEGPGAPPEQLSRLTERFFRGTAEGAEGSGLGLAIVRRIAELHGARLTLANRPGKGMRAELRWGAERPES
jgi:two-component system sensor histidine kinase QseC